ncbi:MAG: hypothetical protein VX899_27125 [Myxococcota bacterium]|nr:hypothetical protein [Myxococcota bacterium]
MMFASTLVLSLLACDRSGEEYTPQPVAGYDGVLDIGEVTPVPLSDLATAAQRRENTVYASVTVPRDQLFGGATASFMADGGEYCVFVDPEAVTWNQSVDLESPSPAYQYADNTDDDGDIDLSVGLSSNYTGTPDLEMGDFEQAYEDSLGNVVTVNTNECVFVGSRGQNGAHAGRATPEYCTVDTALHPDRRYTIALDTWSLPMDDDLLSFGLIVAEGACSDLIDTLAVECVVPNEACSPEREAAGDCKARETAFGLAEAAYCAGEQATFCGCTLNPSVDNPSCNTCDDGGRAGFSFDGETLSYTTYTSGAACDGAVDESFSADVAKVYHCAD